MTMRVPSGLDPAHLPYCACLALSIFTLVTHATRAKRVDTVGCFLCQSYNGSEPACDDPFHPATVRYSSPCQQGMPGHIGEFPASYCIKMAGTSMSSGVHMTVRTCLLESLHHQCGIFSFQQELYQGCISTCEEDGCNHAPDTSRVSTVLTIVLTLLTSLSAVFGGMG